MITDYNQELSLPAYSVQTDTLEKKGTVYNFKIGKIDSDINIFGFWNIKIGYGFGVTIYPEVTWILTIPGMMEGIIFDQTRLLSLDWKTDNGVYLHLFFNDDPDDTEYTFRYDVGTFFNSLYITNKPGEIKINPYRSIKGGRAQDINFGFDYGNNIYKGRFDLQFDSVKTIIDTFKGGRQEIESRLLATQYERGIYFYLPDKNISDVFEVYISDSNGEYFNDSSSTDSRRYKRMQMNIDYVLDNQNGTIKFSGSVYKKQVLVYYKALVSGGLYEVGSIQCGRRGLQGNIDFDRYSNPEYFTRHSSKYYLILNYDDNFTYFEEKNSYRIARSGTRINQLSSSILNEKNKRQNGFDINYDEYTGCLRITKSNTKGDIYNIYPFYDYIDTDKINIFYLSFYTPESKYNKNFIEYSCLLSQADLKLTNKPIHQTILVYLNSVLLTSDKYFYDSAGQNITLNFDLNSTDIIEVHYLTDEEDTYNLTASLKNDFRLNDYLILGDSLWYKMPVKLWEESYYFNPHSIELLYFTHLTGDYKKFLLNDKNGDLKFDINAGFSMYYPELKGITIIDDFEYELTGYKLSLHYKDWYPVDLPTTYGAADGFDPINGKGRLYYRNMHALGTTSGFDFISIYDKNKPSREDYKNNANIGPYSSCDGFTYDTAKNKFTDKKNTLSLVTEFELDANEAVSFSLPVSSINELLDFSEFNSINLAVKRENLTGQVRIFVDAGKTSERYDVTNTVVQKEVIDEGLSYHINDGGSYYMYKGKKDGINSTNDFDDNGLLDADGNVVSEISTFTDLETSLHYAVIDKKYNNINLTIDNPERLKNCRAVRITIYSPGGAKGSLIFNQIRFAETGWIYDKTTGSSDALEISPIEDNYLLRHIFSKDNPDIDKSLHYQRYKERTMMIRLKQNDPFYIEKKFIKPIDISAFKKMNIFILMQEKTERKIKITLVDTNGNKMSDKFDLKNVNSDKWEKMEFYYESFDGYNKSNRLISGIKIEFLNESSDIADNVFYLDEICMEDAIPLFGFSTKNEFVYSEPGFNIQYGDFNVFKSPYIREAVSFSTYNFMINEISPLKDNLLENDFTLKYTLAEVDWYFYSLLDFLLREDQVFNSLEKYRMKFSRDGDIKNPLMFTVYYDYFRFSIPVYKNQINTDNMNQNRNLLLELGADFIGYANFKFGYNIISSIKNYKNTSNRLYTDYTININNIYNRMHFSLFSEKNSKDISGNFSLDNFGYLFRYDFNSFIDKSINKALDFDFHSGFFMAEPVYFKNDIILKHYGNLIDINKNFIFDIKYTNNIELDIKAKYLDRENNIFIIQYGRFINFNRFKYYKSEIIGWDEYFQEFSDSFNYITEIVFYPPFSSLYKDGGRHLVGVNTKFNQLNDSVKLSWDWSIYLEPGWFLPYSFSTGFYERIVNLMDYDPSYTISVMLNGGGDTPTMNLKDIEFKYSISENISIKKDENNYDTENNIYVKLVSFKSLEVENSFNYRQYLTDNIFYKKIEHRFTYGWLLYINFFKRDYDTDDEYGFELSLLLQAGSFFHNMIGDWITTIVDNPIKIDFTPKLGYRFNHNFTLNGTIHLAYSLDYSQREFKYVSRFGAEFVLEGNLSF